VVEAGHDDGAHAARASCRTPDRPERVALTTTFARRLGVERAERADRRVGDRPVAVSFGHPARRCPAA
jgi:hypothetical protein